jgi:hypothetical protein
VGNTPGAEFVQPIQTELQDKTGISQVPSHRIRNENTFLLVPTKYPLCQKFILPAALRRKHRSKASHKANELTSSPYKCALQAASKRKRDSKNRPRNFRQKQKSGVKCPLNFYMTVGFVRFRRRA